MEAFGADFSEQFDASDVGTAYAQIALIVQQS
jgi:hypothetical protein